MRVWCWLTRLFSGRVRVIHVTTLQGSGPGSFRAALEATEPRVLIFRRRRFRL